LDRRYAKKKKKVLYKNRKRIEQLEWHFEILCIRMTFVLNSY
jgi:hypothetical protein